ncbi:hypothetical protein G9A89_022444 [Geosiphon pyriformis]|nr:hypothetical protein G9A89_022444 [Geosiphon pyriformis]
MSGFSAKRRSARVSTIGSVSRGSTYRITKPLNSIKLSSVDKNLKVSGSIGMGGQSTSIDTDGKASDDRATPDSQTNTPNAKHFNTGVAISSPIGSINYDMDDKEEVSLPLCLSFSLEKVWVNPKIVKSQVEIAVKKSFALDINLSTVKGKLAIVKTQVIRKLFSTINGFGGATTPLKFEGII